MTALTDPAAFPATEIVELYRPAPGDRNAGTTIDFVGIIDRINYQAEITISIVKLQDLTPGPTLTARH